ncbi:hypothetical protein [Aquimarina sediminis]|uniref:hypothetical protein n=1 Tax=Aquimarina sediminis TaxID=2070536 RepID=UPI000CA07760|nr:hypothetical protein [Aquimarina sediminis]
MFSIFIQLLFVLNNFNAEVPEFVKDYHEISTREMELTFIEKYSNSNTVSIKGYVISLKMKQSKYKFSPLSKLKIFKKEKENLELLIFKNPKNVHLRYIRLVIQEELPRILNYSSDIKKDKEFLKMILEKKDSTDYLDSYILKNTSL